MKKVTRHQLIKDIISNQRLRTQEALQVALRDKGVEVTQATLSRDLRAIGLLKLRDENGNLYYGLASSNRFRFSESVHSYISRVDRADFMLVLHTELGEASVLANLIDEAVNDEIIGTVAGADTLLVICRDKATAVELEKELIVKA